MCNWRAWLLPGLLTLVLLTAIAVLVRGGSIEADLTARSLQMFEADGTPWASAALDGRDVTLSGTAPTLAARDAAMNAAQRVAGVFRIDTAGLDVLPLAEPYTLSLAVDPQSVTVTGSFPDGVTRASLLDDVRAVIGTKTLVDETTLARGAPIGFDDLASFAIAGLPALDSGTISLDGSTLSITGDAATLDGYTAELARLAEPPSSLTTGDIALNPPTVSPYTWSADATESGVTLSGFVPDDATRSMILDAAASLGTVTDSMELGFGAPDGFADAAAALLTQMQTLDNASGSITDRDLTLSGDAADSTGYDAANAFLSGLPTGFDSISGRIAPPIADPFITTLVKTGEGFSLSGVLPDETARAVILDALGSESVIDTSTVARGAPENIAIGDLFTSIASSFRDLSNATATLTGAELVVTGTASSFSAATGAEAALTALGTDTLSVAADITPGPASPFNFGASVEDSAIALQGFVPDEEVREAILADLAALYPGRDVIDGLTVADGAPEGFLAMVQAGLRGLGRLVSGNLQISDTNALISGDAYYQNSVDRIAETISSTAPQSFSLTAAIGTLDPPGIIFPQACQIQLRRLLSGNTIRFETGSAAINALSNGLLDRMVRILQSCPNATVEIAGHTDAQGSEEANLTLSQARAEAVSAYLADAGIPQNRLLAVGYGETDPIADNESEDGRAQNRRIEFTVQR
ncbi:MAG: OmpA family protein [Hyphomicrobiales bacterium]|jgi:OOP family OmpA-OmpF porin